MRTKEMIFNNIADSMGLNAKYKATELMRNNTYNLIACLKLIRVLRLGRLINYLNESDEFKL
jgi:hypothetical protein